jgi:hypothetical protein
MDSLLPRGDASRTSENVVGDRGSSKQGTGARPEKMGQPSIEFVVGDRGSNKQGCPIFLRQLPSPFLSIVCETPFFIARQGLSYPHRDIYFITLLHNLLRFNTN